ncbi:MAG: T9SS type A sorting domain-containing protein [Saprospiraceae bacterium]|nr:T9SS type A sorting domain-containing protein [Saprospiraceae bacterium]
MKTKLLLLLIVIAFTSLAGQNYYRIVFAGNPENVSVQNITQNKSVSLPGTDTLHLKFKGTSVRETGREHQKLTIYPNPMDQTCNFDFDNQKPGRVLIQVFNTNGNLVHKYSNKLSQGIQHFQLSGVPSGVYVIDIKTTTGHYSGNFVSTDKSNTAFLLMNKSGSSDKTGKDEIINVSNDTDIENTLLDYRNSVELDFATGDQLKFIGYKTGFENDTVYASPTGDQTITFAFCAKPAQPSAISGNSNPCTGATESYSVSNVSGTIHGQPSDWTITAGQNTNSITVTVGTSSGNIIVIPSNDCGSGPANSLTVTTNTVPAQPSAISGIYNPCQGATGVIYSVNNVAGVTYTWSVPSDWTITAGQNTNSITVTAGTSSGNITVIPTNTCGNGPTNSYAVTAQTEALQPSAINGKENPCPGNSEIYSVTNVFGINYLWSVPSDWTITAGQNTNNITVTVGTASGNITVTPNNGCGNGASRSLAVTTQTGGAGQPSAITGNSNPCQGSTGLIYSVINVAGLIYTWTVPAGWTITAGQATNSITVTAGTEAGNITVTPSNDCGNGPANSIAVTTHIVPALPSEITGDNNPCAMSEGEYSVAELPGVSYVWTVPTGWTITEGQNTNTIYIITDETSGTVSVTPSNECGNGAARTLEVTIKDPPVQPSEISGNTNPCQGSIGLIYSVDNDLDVNYYSWTIPTGWTIISGHLTNSIAVTAGTTSGNISVIPVGDCGYGTSRTLAITTKLIPSQPSSISGNSAPCEETTGLVYSVTNVPGVTYLWAVPTDWTITSGQGTYSITVTAGFDWGNITVTPSNDCGNGPSRTLAVSTQVIPDQPSAISGNDNPCQGATGLIYSVYEESYVVYTWTVPSGWTITAGQNTSSITVIVGTSSGNIIVILSNDCGDGTANSLAVTTQTVPEQPSTITGSTNPCQGTTGLVYSVTDVPGVIFSWDVPGDWIITSGTEENTITVTAGTASGNITVIPFNECGEGPAQTLAVIVQLIPAQPSAITGNNNPCQGTTGLSYSVTDVSGVTYFWTVPTGWTITAGQNTNSITVTAGTASGNITVTPSNTCGNGTANSLAVTTQTVPAQPSAITGNNNPCQGATGLNYSVTTLPE